MERRARKVGRRHRRPVRLVSARRSSLPRGLAGRSRASQAPPRRASSRTSLARVASEVISRLGLGAEAPNKGGLQRDTDHASSLAVANDRMAHKLSSINSSCVATHDVFMLDNLCAIRCYVLDDLCAIRPLAKANEPVRGVVMVGVALRASFVGSRSRRPHFEITKRVAQGSCNPCFGRLRPPGLSARLAAVYLWRSEPTPIPSAEARILSRAALRPIVQARGLQRTMQAGGWGGCRTQPCLCTFRAIRSPRWRNAGQRRPALPEHVARHVGATQAANIDRHDVRSCGQGEGEDLARLRLPTLQRPKAQG